MASPEQNDYIFNQSLSDISDNWANTIIVIQEDSLESLSKVSAILLRPHTLFQFLAPEVRSYLKHHVSPLCL